MQPETSAPSGPIERMFSHMPLELRLKTAYTVAHDYATTQMAGEDLALAESILNYLCHDDDATVRTAIADQVNASDILPRDIALKLARDNNDVALPMVSTSPALTDEDLRQLFEEASVKKQIAIAARSDLSETVTEKISEDGCLGAVEACLKNRTSAFGDIGYHAILERFGDEDIIQELLVRRRNLPKAVVTHLYEILPDEYKQIMLEKGPASENISAEMILNARERMAIRDLDRRMTDYEQKKACLALQRSNRLTPTLMLRLLLNDNQTFFNAALAETSGISKKRVASLISGRGYLGFRRLYDRAALPQFLYAGFRGVLEEFRKATHYHPRADKENFRQRLVDRVAHEYGLDDDLGIDELMEKLLPMGTE